MSNKTPMERLNTNFKNLNEHLPLDMSSIGLNSDVFKVYKINMQSENTKFRNEVFSYTDGIKSDHMRVFYCTKPCSEDIAIFSFDYMDGQTSIVASTRITGYMKPLAYFNSPKMNFDEFRQLLNSFNAKIKKDKVSDSKEFFSLFSAHFSVNIKALEEEIDLEKYRAEFKMLCEKNELVINKAASKNQEYAKKAKDARDAVDVFLLHDPVAIERAAIEVKIKELQERNKQLTKQMNKNREKLYEEYCVTRYFNLANDIYDELEAMREKFAKERKEFFSKIPRRVRKLIDTYIKE